MSKTAIEWTDFTVNPIRARNLETGAVGHFCEKISPGCAHCYASALQKRFRMPNFPGANKRLPTMPLVTDRATVQINERLEVFLDENVLRQVLRRRKPTKFFWCDMTDLLGSWVPDEWIDRCLAVMALTGQHIHQVLTKRAERLPAYFAPGRSDQIYQAVQQLAEQYGIADYLFDDWPWPNVWLGVSGEDQPRINERHAFLSSTVAGVHFWSLEPLLGSIDCNQAWRNSKLPNWVIVGGESGPNARACNLRWIRSIIEQCRAVGVACFVKQLGANPQRPEPYQGMPEYPYSTGKGGDPNEWPEDLRVRQFPQVEWRRCSWAERDV